MSLKPLRLLCAVAASAIFALSAQAKESKASDEQVQCKDGTLSSTKGRGACSGHGGVLKTSTADDAKAKASSAAEDAKSKASGAAQDAKSKAASTAEKVKNAKDDTVLCKDGTVSKAGRGACSRHGGVAESPTQAGRPPAPAARTGQPGTGGSEPGFPRQTAPQTESGRSAPSAPTAGTPTAKCKDGTFSYAKQHEGACSHHGGVAQWFDTNR
jgi:hypothetical protein